MKTAVKKADRQKRILELVHEHEVATQTELQSLLRNDGIEVDQGTVSRDIHELGLVRVPTPDGWKYAPVEEASPVVPARNERLAGRLVKSAEKSKNLIVLRTDPGNAQVVGLAIDKLGWREIVGTVAGDDTLLVVVREGVPASKVMRKILELREK